MSVKDNCRPQSFAIITRIDVSIHGLQITFCMAIPDRRFLDHGSKMLLTQIEPKLNSTIIIQSFEIMHDERNVS